MYIYIYEQGCPQSVAVGGGKNNIENRGPSTDPCGQGCPQSVAVGRAKRNRPTFDRIDQLLTNLFGH